MIMTLFSINANTVLLDLCQVRCSNWTAMQDQEHGPSLDFAATTVAALNAPDYATRTVAALDPSGPKRALVATPTAPTAPNPPHTQTTTAGLILPPQQAKRKARDPDSGPQLEAAAEPMTDRADPLIVLGRRLAKPQVDVNGIEPQVQHAPAAKRQAPRRTSLAEEQQGPQDSAVSDGLDSIDDPRRFNLRVAIMPPILEKVHLVKLEPRTSQRFSEFESEFHRTHLARFGVAVAKSKVLYRFADTPNATAQNFNEIDPNLCFDDMIDYLHSPYMARLVSPKRGIRLGVLSLGPDGRGDPPDQGSPGDDSDRGQGDASGPRKQIRESSTPGAADLGSSHHWAPNALELDRSLVLPGPAALQVGASSAQATADPCLSEELEQLISAVAMAVGGGPGTLEFIPCMTRH
eukprot:m.250466 g.250466  ORF g.250466 m.250466 type:complete len:406 (+) comp16727_c0_seq1:89-1306(+)